MQVLASILADMPLQASDYLRIPAITFVIFREIFYAATAPSPAPAGTPTPG
jgi:hypothetical protein